MELRWPQKGCFVINKALLAKMLCYAQSPHPHIPSFWVLGNHIHDWFQCPAVIWYLIIFLNSFFAGSQENIPIQKMDLDLGSHNFLNCCQMNHKIGSSHVGAFTYDCQDLRPKFQSQLQSQVKDYLYSIYPLFHKVCFYWVIWVKKKPWRMLQNWQVTLLFKYLLVCLNFRFGEWGNKIFTLLITSRNPVFQS